MLPNGSRQQSFDDLFTGWANAALIDGGYTTRTIPSHDRIPSTVKEKVVELWESGIIRPDRNEAYFCIADRKNGNGSRYKWFSKGEGQIVPNWEYFVQLAGFRDLLVEYGYPKEWMKFEHHESTQSVNVAVDIGIKMPGGDTIFVEVKETDIQLTNLISETRRIGEAGFSLDEPDRGNDPLRKAKYIIGGHPSYFAGYSPAGFDAYQVIYHEGNRFRLVKTELPPAPKESLSMIDRLVSYLEDGFKEPLKTIERLRSSARCSGDACSVNCHDLLSHFSQSKAWSDKTFFHWCSQWYASERYEEPLNAFFTLPMVGMFLAKQGLKPNEIARAFEMEFKGGGRLAHMVPSCLFKGTRPVSIEKRINGHYMCADFVLLPPLPPVAAEIKVAMPDGNAKVAFDLFRKDLRKCEEWLKPDANPHIEKRFGIDRFDSALALLIDLGCKGLGDLWRSGINEDEFRRKGIVVKRIVVGSDHSTILPKKIVSILRDTSKATQEVKPVPISNTTPPAKPVSSIPPPAPDAINRSLTENLEIAVQSGLKCQERTEQTGVEIPLQSWEDAQFFAAGLKNHIREYNRTAAVPVHNASPWVWRTTSSGNPLTENGRAYGVELRFSPKVKGIG